MHIGSPFITHTQASKLMQPGESAFDHPARHTKVAAMPGAALGELRMDATLPQDTAITLAIVSTVGLYTPWFAQGPATPPGDCRNPVEQRHELGRIVTVSASQDQIQWCTVAVDDEVVLAARLAPISRVGPSFFPPCTARTDELSAITREKSSRFALRSFASKMRCSFSHTPAFCQSRARRQHVMPEPHPISLGSNSHGKPVCRMKMMPVNMRRSSKRLRPAGDLCGGGVGSNGRTISHSSSSTNSRAMMSLHQQAEKTIGPPLCDFVRRSKVNRMPVSRLGSLAVAELGRCGGEVLDRLCSARSGLMPMRQPCWYVESIDQQQSCHRPGR